MLPSRRSRLMTCILYIDSRWSLGYQVRVPGERCMVISPKVQGGRIRLKPVERLYCPSRIAGAHLQFPLIDLIHLPTCPKATLRA